MQDQGRPPPVGPPLGPDHVVVERQSPGLVIFAVILLTHGLAQTQAGLVEGRGALLTEDEGPALGADEAPVTVDVGGA